MNTKKTLRLLSITTTILFAIACQKESQLKEAIAVNSVDLPADYMYTLTIPEIMELGISNPEMD